MLGYALFLIPMAIAFVWLSYTQSVKQALLDLLAFNLLFNFDFAALLPNNSNVLLIHLLLLVFVGLELLNLLTAKRFSLSVRAILIFLAAFLLLSWLGGAILVNKIGAVGARSVINYILRVYGLNTLFIIVGMRLAKSGDLERFGKVFLLASALVGVISIVQASSGGVLLTSERNDKYLGLFQPLGERAVNQRDLAEAVINYLYAIQTIRFGDLSFFRASGTFNGSYVSLCLAALMSLCLLTSRKGNLVLPLFVTLFLSIAGFVAAFNRTAIVTFIFLAGLIFLVRFRALLSSRVILRWCMPILFAALIAVVFSRSLSTVVAANLDRFIGSRADREVSSLNGRSSLWAYVISEVRRSPIVGSGQAITLYRAGWGVDDNTNVDLTAHNSFLEFAYRGGIVPAVLFIILFCFCLLRSWKLFRNSMLPSRLRLIFFTLLIAIVGIGLLNMTASMMTVPQSAALFWILCGYLATYTPASNRTFSTRRRAYGSLASQPLG